MIYHGYFWKIREISEGKVTFYYVVDIIHGVIITDDPYPYRAKFVFVGFRHDKYY